MGWEGKHEIRGEGWSEPHQLKSAGPDCLLACAEGSTAVFPGVTPCGQGVMSHREVDEGMLDRWGGAAHARSWTTAAQIDRSALQEVRVVMSAAPRCPFPVGTSCSRCSLDSVVATPTGRSGKVTYV